MVVKNYSPGGVMLLKTGGVMVLKNHVPKWGHASEKSHLTAILVRE